MVHISFNQDKSCFTYGKNNGFAVYNCEPLKERFNRFSMDIEEDSVNIVEILFKSNIIAIVKTKKPNVLQIWDDHQEKVVGEIEFKHPVCSVLLKREYLLITTIDKTFLYHLQRLIKLTEWKTFHNSNGISSMAYSSKSIFAVLGEKAGEVRVKNLDADVEHCILAHNNPIALIALNMDGDKLATVSDRGTIVRIWDTSTGVLIKEFRRGIEVARVTSLSFDSNGTRILVSSDRGTLHVFSLGNDVGNKKSSITYFSNYLPQYFNSEWSAISFQVPVNSVCCFSPTPNIIYVINKDNVRFFKFKYNPEENVNNCIENTEICNLSNY